MPIRIKASARFPLEGVDWQRKLLIGGMTGLLLELLFVGLAYLASGEAAFGLAPHVVILNFPALGYIYQAYAGTIRRELATPPEWQDWPVLLGRGLIVFGVCLVYGALPLLMLILGLGLLVKGGVILFVGMVVMVLGLLAGIFSLFFLPMALARYIEQGRIEAAFHPGLLWAGIDAALAEYVAVYLLAVGAHIVAGMVAALPYVGPLLLPFLWFYMMLVLVRLFGEICARTG
jgi:hypothetical protein